MIGPASALLKNENAVAALVTWKLLFGIACDHQDDINITITSTSPASFHTKPCQSADTPAALLGQLDTVPYLF